MAHTNGASDLPPSELPRDQLEKIVLELREENTYLRKAVAKLMAEADPLEIDAEALFRDFDKYPTLGEVIRSLEAGEI